LELLRSLFGPAFEFFDLCLHGGDSLLFLHYFELQTVLRFFLCLLTGGGEPVLYSLFDREF
jgi:hypothetical protein